MTNKNVTAGVLQRLRAAFRPGSILFRSILIGAVLVVFAAVLTAVATWRVVDAFEQRAVYARLRDSERALHTMLQAMEADLDTRAAGLGAHPAVEAHVLGREDPGLEAVLQPLLQLSDVDFIAVVVPGTSARAVPEAFQAAALTALPEDVPGHPGGALRQLVPLPDGSLVWRAVAPVGGPGGPRGYVVVGHLFGRALSQRFKAATGLDSAVSHGGQVVGSSISAPALEAELRRVVGSALVSPIQASRWNTLELMGWSYGALHVPLQVGGPEPVATLSIISPRVLSAEQQNTLLGELLFFVLELGVLGAISASILTRGVARPLEALSGAVRRIRDGDLATPVHGGGEDELGVLAREVDEMREKLQAAMNGLAIEKSRYQGIFDSLSEAVFTADLDGRLTSANPAAQKLFDRAWPRVAGADCFGEFGLLSDGRPVCDLLCLREPGRLSSVTARARAAAPHAAGPPVEVVLAPIRDGSGEVVGIVHIARDMSQQEELQRRKNRFLLTVAHELQTPLASLLASVDVLRDYGPAMPHDERDRMLERVQRGALRLRNLLSNLLDLGSIEAGSFPVNRRPMDLGACLENAIALCEQMLRAKRQTVVLHELPPLPPVYADAWRISQVITNLLVNCGKYAPEEDRIEVRVWLCGSEVWVAVSDHGPGVPESESSRVFDYLHSGAKSDGTGVHGFGLGLAISKGIIDAHGGAIGIENTPGGGATVWFTVPLAVSTVTERTPVPSSRSLITH